jgi:cytoskeletal protein CcmA (bactofilin family)
MALKGFMGMTDKPATGPMASEGESTPKVAIPAPRTVAPTTSIDATTQLSGKLRCEDTIRIDGRVKGEIRCEKTVFVGEAASVEATIQADAVAISGEVKGDISAVRKITLESTARVTGDLATPGIVIEEGAKLEGRIVIGAEQPSAAQKKSETRPAPARREPAADTAPAQSQGTAPSAG